jgi:hypothetical protein
VTKPARPAAVNFYLDADVLGLAKLLALIRPDVTYPGDPGGPVKGGRVRAPCVQAVRDSGARMVTLVSRQAVDTFHQLEVLMCQWRRIDAIRHHPGPFIYAASRTSFKQIALS